MVYYLDNGDKFLFYIDVEGEVIFVLFSSLLGRPLATSTRWMKHGFGSKGHVLNIEKLLQSENSTDTIIGKEMLCQMFKVTISGDIVGYRGDIDI